MNINENAVKIPVLTQYELIELGNIMHEKDEFKEIRFWAKIYERKGLDYNLEENLLKLFNKLAYNGNMHLNFGEGGSIDTMADKDKINIIKIIYKIEEDENK